MSRFSQRISIIRHGFCASRLRVVGLDLRFGKRCSPRCCLFVDDHPVNLPPAEALGITIVLATTENETADELERLLGVEAALVA